MIQTLWVVAIFIIVSYVWNWLLITEIMALLLTTGYAATVLTCLMVALFIRPYGGRAVLEALTDLLFRNTSQRVWFETMIPGLLSGMILMNMGFFLPLAVIFSFYFVLSLVYLIDMNVRK